MKRIRFALTLAALPSAPFSDLAGQDSALTALLSANRHALSIENGRLAGPGGRMLVEEGLAARFFLVGEEHGVAELPGLVQTLLNELRPGGYTTFAVEVSPLQGERLDAMARRGNAAAALDSLQAAWYSAVPFYTLVEERRLLASAMAPLNGLPAMRIWGLDYEISADRYYLAELEQLVPAAGRPAVQRARALADTGWALFAAERNPSRAFAWSAPDSVFTALRQALGSRPPARARQIVDVFERSARINRLFLSGRGYESNQDRSRYMRENFAARLAAAESAGARPRVLFKFGGSHMMRGFNYTHSLDLGTAAPIVAEAGGEKSFHILIMGGPGTKTARMDITQWQYAPIGTAEIDGANTAWLRPALPDSGWVVFDMRPVRLGYVRRRNQTLNPIQDRFLHAYDAIVVLLGSTPGETRPLLVR